MEIKDQYDVIIIGGSYAGLSAAMALGRAMRKTLILDSGKPCNRFTPHAHNFITHDGKVPADIAAEAREQVMKYPGIDLMEGIAVSGRQMENGFEIVTGSGRSVYSKKLLFATGVTDELPAIKGFEACWGKSVVHCPYCHGYEIRDQQLGILANGAMAFEFARMISNWSSRLIVFTNGASTLSAEQAEKLLQKKILIVETQIAELQHNNGYLDNVLLEDGHTIALNALFAKVPFSQSSNIPHDLGCRFTEHGHIEVDDLQRTTIAGVFAAGDNTTMFRTLSAAIASGTKAGAMLNKELTDDSF
ncbi:NAD(P)/FAD-dependent oxidoreductase [Ferruginibacter sp. HRS2-29]|uniref:NAD(P)/FAD-dependent oxidoreductase n=1 Tax=Ferruginibacter sp. HRS2-29 TaxID=2487334 RepID=UPI0020CC50A2|nr:NAD(P)/FAD-dependent oxidoreductase [Ferruginibacter sp. HRS2-29]MCP9752234.1 NAD(P)/FAD-dependent oxidoreductase [Ferruginibacter sp. HRS2-29]